MYAPIGAHTYLLLVANLSTTQVMGTKTVPPPSTGAPPLPVLSHFQTPAPAHWQASSSAFTLGPALGQLSSQQPLHHCSGLHHCPAIRPAHGTCLQARLKSAFLQPEGKPVA